jgi:hypothetical protein
VDDWSEEQLEEWARVNITKDTIPQLDWHQRQVAIWARKVLHFDAEDEAALKKAKLNGQFLSAVPSLKALIKLYGIASGPAGFLWPQIEKMTMSLAEPERKRKRGDDSTSDREPRKKAKSELEHIINNTTNLPQPNVDAYVTRDLPWTSRMADSEDVLTRVLASLRQVITDWNSTDTRSIPLFTLTGASGIGKTRFGVELLSLLQQNASPGEELSQALNHSRLINAIITRFINKRGGSHI